MNIDERNGRSRTLSMLTANLAIGMGCIFLFMSGVILYTGAFGNMELQTWQVYGLSTLLALYGIFRIWRGINDKKMRRREMESDDRDPRSQVF
jgi:hypothetical protein